MIDKIYSLVQDQRHQDAILEASSYHLSNPSSLDALALYVDLLLNYSFFEKADEVLMSSEFANSKDLNVYFLYRDIYSRSGNQAALQELDEDFGIVSRSEHSPSKLGELSSIEYDHQYFKQQLIEFIDDLIHRYHQSHSHIKKAMLRAKNGMLPEAIFNLKKYSSLTDSADIRYLIRAELALVDGDYSKSRKMYGRLSKENRYKLHSLNRLGDIANALGDNEEAHKLYKSAIELAPDHLNTLTDLIRTLILEGKNAEAKRFYNKAKTDYGEDKVKFLKPLLKRKQIVCEAGTVFGLVWSEVTGNILPIEIMLEQSTVTDIQCMGNIGYLMRDSVNTVMSVLAHSKYSDSIDHSKIQLNVPHSSVFKDGPSAGLAVLAGIINKLLGHSDLVNHAFTGEVSLAGKVLPVGGIPEKVFGAYMHGITNIFLPAGNHFELSGISNTIKDSVNFHFVSHYREIGERLWLA